MFRSKKKDREDKNKGPVVIKTVTNEKSYELQRTTTYVQQSTITVTNVNNETERILETTTLGSSAKQLETKLPSGPRLTAPLSLNKTVSPLRSTTKKDWRPSSATEVGNKSNSEFQSLLSTWSLRDSETQQNIFGTSLFKTQSNPGFLQPVQLLSTDAVPANKYTPQPYKSAFNNVTSSSYSNKITTPTVRKTSLSTTRLPIDSRPFMPATGASSSKPVAYKIADLQSKVKIKVVKTKIFYDNDTTAVPTYKTNSKSRGKVLVINNVVFQDKNKDRAGADVDEANITELFKQMGFKVERHTNKTKKEMESVIKTYRNDKGLSKYDINVVVIMSHGFGSSDNSTQIATIDHYMISTTWIIEQFDSANCQSLMNKPKIFIFQCCRGDQQDVAVDAVQIKPSRIQADLLLAYSTIPGYVSHRDPKLGTWYIQAICKVFMEHAHNTDVENLLKIVDSQLASIPSYGARQTSSYENRGFKRCFLHPM